MPSCWSAGRATASRPPPAAGILTTAKRRAIDRLRREAALRDKQALLARELEEAVRDLPGEDAAMIPDERLGLVFACCHPALATEAQVPLTLRLVGDLTVAEIARALLIPEATVAQRLVRAKQKVRLSGIPLAEPPPNALADRLAAVHAQAPRADATEWRQIALLYEALARVLPSPVVTLNGAVAVAMAEGPEPGCG